VRQDRARYWPQPWTDARERGRQAGLPEDRGVATTPPLTARMRARAWAAGGPAAGGTGDRVYGHHCPRRRGLEAHPQAYVLAVSGQASGGLGTPPRQVQALLARVPVEGWTRLRVHIPRISAT
jgi:hypothetical protein